MTWLYLRKGGSTDEGPIAAGRIRRMVENGELPFDAQVKREKEEHWQDAHAYFGVTPSCGQAATDQPLLPTILTEPESPQVAKNPLFEFVVLTSKLLQLASVNAGLVAEIGGLGYVLAVVFAPMLFIGRVMGYGLFFGLLGAYAAGWRWWWLAGMAIGEMLIHEHRERKSVAPVRNYDYQTGEKKD